MFVAFGLFLFSPHEPFFFFLLLLMLSLNALKYWNGDGTQAPEENEEEEEEEKDSMNWKLEQALEILSLSSNLLFFLALIILGKLGSNRESIL